MRACADTSALIGLLDAEPDCIRLRGRYEWFTTHAHLLEVFGVLSGRTSMEKAWAIVRDLLPLSVAIPDGALQPATEIRHQLRARRKGCSYLDALGYGVARALKVPLMIADESFADLPGVEPVRLRPPAEPRGKPGR